VPTGAAVTCPLATGAHFSRHARQPIFCLQALVAKGLLKMQNFQSNKRKLAYAYLLTPAGLLEKAALTSRFLKRKTREYELLKAEIETLRREEAAA